MTDPAPSALRWRKATASQGSQGCVELAPMPGGLAIRDSKDPDGPRLDLGLGDARAMIETLKSGLHDA
ncbi:DUF397 domain-containing protein [Spirillospora sp. NPDC052242]